jgi:hypothetical protein
MIVVQISLVDNDAKLKLLSKLPNSIYSNDQKLGMGFLDD